MSFENISENDKEQIRIALEQRIANLSEKLPSNWALSLEHQNTEAGRTFGKLEEAREILGKLFYK